MPPGSPVLQNNEEPEGNNDPSNPLNPDIDEEHTTRTHPPAADFESPPDAEVFDDAGGSSADGDDNDSELEELDEKEFEDFDPSALNIPDKPIAVDADNVGLLGVHKRKRTEEEERARKKKKEGRREKTKKRRRVRAGADDDDMFEGGEEIDGKRARKSKLGADGRHVRRDRRVKTPEINDEELSPEERKSFTRIPTHHMS